MKRKFKFVALMLAFVMLMTSCTGGGNNDKTDAGTTTDNTEEKEDTRFLYTIESGKLVRYDVVEQKETIACPDPLCEHNTEDCLVSDIYHFHVTNDYIAYVKELDDGWLNELYLYNLDTGSIVAISTIDDGNSIFQIYYPWVSKNCDYVFFTASEMMYDEKGNSTDEIWYAYRYNIASKELEKINNGEKISTAYRVVEDTGEQLIWYSNVEASFYNSDYDFGNFKGYDFIGEKAGDYYIYSDISYTEYGDNYRTIYRQNIETGNIEQILDNVSEMRYDNTNSPCGIAYTGFDYIEEYGYNAKSEIWYFDFSTSESRLLIDVEDISEEFDTVHIQSSAGYNDYAGGYMMIEIGHTYTYVNEDNEEKMSFYATHNLFINPETGDWFIMEPLY